MDRRGFVRSVLGLAAAAATSTLWLPPISTAVAHPARRLFVPPATGWLPPLGWGGDEDLADWLRLESMDADGFTITRPRVVQSYVGSFTQTDGPAWMVSGLGFQPSGVVLSPITEWSHALNDGDVLVTAWTADGEIRQAYLSRSRRPTGSAGSS